MSLMDRLSSLWRAPAALPDTVEAGTTATAATATAPAGAPIAEPAIGRTDVLLLIDVRTEREFALGAVEGAINLPLNDLPARILSVAQDRAAPVVVYCASGGRSQAAAQVMRQLGYQDVRNAGGLYAAAAGLGRSVR